MSKQINTTELYNKFTYDKKYIKTITIEDKHLYWFDLKDIINEKNVFITKISLLNSNQRFRLEIGGYKMDIINDVLNIKIPLDMCIYHELKLVILDKQNNRINIEYIKYINILNINETIVYLDDDYFKGNWMFICGFLSKIYKINPLVLSNYKYINETPDNEEHFINKYWNYLYTYDDNKEKNNEDNIVTI